LLEDLQAKAATLVRTSAVHVALYDGRFATVRAMTIKDLLLVEGVNKPIDRTVKLLSLLTLIENKPITVSQLLDLHHTDLNTLAVAASKATKM
jgi:hypothetical protein